MRVVKPYTAQTRQQARLLRGQGQTYTEICSQIGPIPKTTLHGWLKDIPQFYSAYADARTKDQPTRKENYRGVCCVQYFDTSLQYELQAIGEAMLK